QRRLGAGERPLVEDGRDADTVVHAAEATESRPVKAGESHPGISIVYITHRASPRFDWFADSLARQLDTEDVEVLFVDGVHSPERSEELEQIVRGRFPYRHVPAKPSPFAGPYRLTTRDYFAAASARNTGLVY